MAKADDINGSDGDALHIIHERLQRMLEIQKIAKIGDWEANLLSGELYWSSVIFDIFGFDPNSFTPSVKAFHEAVHPDDRSIVLESEKRSELTGLHDVVHRIIRQDGEIRIVHELARRYTDSSGKPIMLRGTVQDITDFKRLENNLQASENRYRTLVELAVDGILLGDINGIITDANKCMCEILGMPREKIIGKEIGCIPFTEESLKKNPFQFDLLKKGEIVLNERVIRRPEGTEVDVEMRTKIMPDGTYQSIYRDITDRKKLEKKLQESEERFRILFNSGKDYTAVHLTGKDGMPTNFVQVNDASCELLGYTREEMLKLKPQDIDSASSSGLVPEIIEKFIKNKYVMFETEMITKNGQRIPMEISLTLIQLQESEATLCVARDITERKQAEAVLKESEEKYRNITENMCDIVVELDHMGIIKYISPTSIRMFGRNNDSQIGRSAFDSIHPEDRDRVAAEYMECVLTKTDREIEYRNRHEDGHYLWLRSIGHSFYDSSGEPAGMIIVSSDITERKQMEKILKENEEKYRSIFAAENDALFLVDCETLSILECNDAACSLYGYSKEEMIKLKNTDMSAEPEETEQATKDFRERIDMRLHKKKDGTVFPVDISSSNLILRDKNVILAAVRDITERRLADEKIKSLLAEKELILREVNHRIKNNMNSLYGILYLQADALKDPESRLALEDCGRRVRSMMVLYDKLYSSTDFQKISVQHYLPSLVDDIISNFPNGQTVKIEKNIDDFILNAKRLQPLGIIINELISNAMKYAFAGRNDGKITVTASLKDGKAIFTIKDNGPGMPESVDFENSTGFGLQLIRMLTKELRGSIRIERENGTKVILEFEI